MPLGKLSFFAYVISQKRSTNQQKQLRIDAFHVKTSQSANNQLNPAKNKNRPQKAIYAPFEQKPSINCTLSLSLLFFLDFSGLVYCNSNSGISLFLIYIQQLFTNVHRA